MKRFFSIVPQLNANDPEDTDETQYIECLPEEAEIWSVMESDTGDDGSYDIVDDFATREAAFEAAIGMGYTPEQEKP